MADLSPGINSGFRRLFSQAQTTDQSTPPATSSVASPGPVSPSQPAIISVEHVNLSFQKEKKSMPVLVDVSLTAYKDEFVALTGPSGCGKSTLLRIMAGLTKSTSGTVRFKGEPITRPRGEIAMVFQNFVLLPWKTSLENVVFGLSARNDLSDDEKKKLGTQALDNAGLSGFENVYPGELSGGMNRG